MQQPVVLLAEDDALVALVAQDALEAGGYAVMATTGGAAALSALEAHSNQLAGLVTDIRMGAGPSGWEIA